MPDFERLLRKLELDCAETQAKAHLSAAKFAGEDRARKQIALVAVIIIFGISAIYIIIGMS